MKRRLPPWGPIEAFIAAAQGGSFKDAAGELGLSSAAFSRRIQALEAHVGGKLFNRATPTPTLTIAGERYLRRLHPAYDAVRAACDMLHPGTHDRPLRIGVPQPFAVSWLVDRLPGFHRVAPEIEIVLYTHRGNTDVLGGEADIAVNYGSGNWDGLVSEEMFQLESFAVGPARMSDGRPPPQRLDDIGRYPLLAIDWPANLWRDWLQRVGYAGPAPAREITFDSIQVVYEATAAGMGLALANYPLSEPYLAQGRVQRLFDVEAPLNGSYHLVSTPELLRLSPVQAFWHWFRREALADRRARMRMPGLRRSA